MAGTASDTIKKEESRMAKMSLTVNTKLPGDVPLFSAASPSVKQKAHRTKRGSITLQRLVNATTVVPMRIPTPSLSNRFSLRSDDASDRKKSVHMRVGSRPPGLEGKRLFKAAGTLIIFLLALKNDVEFRDRLLGGVNRRALKDTRMKLNISPTLSFAWEVFHSAYLVFILFIESYVLTFVLSRGDLCISGLCTFAGQTAWVSILTTIPVIDILFSWVTPIKDNVTGNLLSHNEDLIKYYFKHRCASDIIALAGSTAALVTGNQYFRFALLARAIHAHRLAYAPDLLIKHIGGKNIDGVDSFVERWFNLLAAGIVVGHLAACSFFLIAVLQNHDYDSWTIVAGVRDWEHFDQYTTALYWAFATMTTVGYGDVTTSTPVERGFGVFMLFVGAIFFSFLVGKMGALSAEMEEISQRTRQEKRMVDSFIQKHDLSPELIKRIRLHQHASQGLMSRNELVSIDNAVLSTFNPALRRDVTMSIKQQVILTVPVLCQSSTPLQYRIAAVLHQEIFHYKEYIQLHGDLPETMYFIEKGSVTVVNLEGHVIQTLMSGSFFGEKAVLRDCRHDTSVRVKTKTAILHALRRHDMEAIMHSFPEFRQMIVSAVQIRNLDGTTLAHAEERTSVKHRPQTPPYGITWRHFRRQFNKFDQYYRSALSRSRTLQAAQYTPTPLDFSQIRLPPRLQQVVQLCAQNLHESWAHQRVLDGWTYGTTRNNAEKMHSRLVPWNELTEEEQNWNIDTTTDLIKMMHKLGYNIQLPAVKDESKKLRWQFGTIPISTSPHSSNFSVSECSTISGSPMSSPVHSNSDCEEYHTRTHYRDGAVPFPNPFDTAHLELPPSLGELVETIASNLHEKWAADRLQEGWKFATVHNDDLKQHHCLLPFEFLSHADKNRNYVSIIEVFKGILFLGCTIQRPHNRGGSMSLLYNSNESLKSMAPPKLFEQGSNLSKTASSVATSGITEIDHGSDAYSVKHYLQTIDERLGSLEERLAVSKGRVIRINSHQSQRHDHRRRSNSVHHIAAECSGSHSSHHHHRRRHSHHHGSRKVYSHRRRHISSAAALVSKSVESRRHSNPDGKRGGVHRSNETAVQSQWHGSQQSIGNTVPKVSNSIDHVNDACDNSTTTGTKLNNT